MSRSINANRKGSPVMASGGDMYQPIKLRRSREPLEVLESRLRFLLAARPPNTDIARLTDWALRCDAVRLEIVIARANEEDERAN